MKVGQTKKLTFGVLRNGLSDGLGVIFDIDTEITRNCRVVLDEDGCKKWQIIKCDINQFDWDYCVDEDQICLDEYEECL